MFLLNLPRAGTIRSLNNVVVTVWMRDVSSDLLLLFEIKKMIDDAEKCIVDELEIGIL